MKKDYIVVCPATECWRDMTDLKTPEGLEFRAFPKSAVVDGAAWRAVKKAMAEEHEARILSNPYTMMPGELRIKKGEESSSDLLMIKLETFAKDMVPLARVMRAPEGVEAEDLTNLADQLELVLNFTSSGPMENLIVAIDLATMPDEMITTTEE